jgi:4-hydroxybenzoate polyprenyltransferase
MRLDKPIGILLLLWPALWALWIASHGQPDFLILSVICLGVILMRSAGCVINDFADRKFDPLVERTQHRPLASGTISSKEAIILFISLLGISFGLVLLLNFYTILLSIIAAFLAASYPFMKRYTYLPQAYLGIAFGFAVPMAFSAQLERLPTIVWLIYAIVIIWAVIYDTLYAMVDKDDDIKIGVKSTAILFGNYDRFIIAILQIVMLLLLMLLGHLEHLTQSYHYSLWIVAGLFGYQQYLIINRDKPACFKAFLNNNYVGLSIFLGIANSYYG